MSELAEKLKPRFTWADYQTWPDGERWEIIGGEAVAMSPAPSLRHQRIAMSLYRQTANYFNGKPCRVYPAPCDLKLSDEDVVQPDLMVVCDRGQERESHIAGPPALVVEILSPSSLVHDRLRKGQLYARSGVKEFWLITPYPSILEVLWLDGGSYRLHGGYVPGDAFVSPGFPDLKLDLKELFDIEIPPQERIAEIRPGSPPGATPRRVAD